MASNRKPTSVTIRSYQVGFGDCFLVSFNYGQDGTAARRHVLIDFGSTSLPKQGGFSLESVAKDIREQTAGKLTAVVATHAIAIIFRGSGDTGADRGPPSRVSCSPDRGSMAQPGATSPPTALAGAKGSRRWRRKRRHAAFRFRRSPPPRAEDGKGPDWFLGEDNLANLTRSRR
jgi:hypothetical protein